MDPDARPTRGAGMTGLIVLAMVLTVAVVATTVAVVVLGRSEDGPSLGRQAVSTSPVTAPAVSREKAAAYERDIAQEFLRSGTGVEDYQAFVDSMRSSLPNGHPHLDLSDPGLARVGLRACLMLDTDTAAREPLLPGTREDDSAVVTILLGGAQLHLCPEHALDDSVNR